MKIRPFCYSDLDALIKIAKVSFSDEYRLQGATPESFIQQIRMITRGRMIPFKLLSALAGIQWQLLVAEAEGKVVGCGAYLGRKQMELTNLMVHPDYRRRGIGQELLVKRLRCLAAEGHSRVATTILASNQASLGNVAKQNFKVFDRYSLYEIPLPFPQHVANVTEQITLRPIQNRDTIRFQAIENQVTNLARLNIYGSAISHYRPSFADALMDRLGGGQQWVRVFSKDEEIIGFLSARTSTTQTKGVLGRPIIADENLNYLPFMLQESATWFSQQGKKGMQITVADERQILIEQLQHMGWDKIHSWVQLVKRLDEPILDASNGIR